jgi:UBX domain-containing protein 1
MSKIRGLFDDKSDNDEGNTESFAGGHRSGLAVENPPDKPIGDSLVIHSYSNGFIVDGGPFRPMSVQENAHFMEQVRAGILPPELQDRLGDRSGLALELRQIEGEFDPRSVQSSGQPRTDKLQNSFKPFSGSSQALTDAQKESRPAYGDVPEPTLNSLSEIVTIQFRFPDGRRISRRFNEDSMGYEVLRLIAVAVSADEASVVLSSGFPPKPLEHSLLQRCSIRHLELSGSTVSVSLRK